MSLINRMLRDLDQRHATGAPPPGAAPGATVRPVTVRPVGSDGFWYVLAGVMVIAVAWVGWLMWQLTPRTVVTDLALQAVGKPVSSPVAAPPPVQPAATAAAGSAGAERVPFDLLQMATELSVLPEPRPAARARPAVAATAAAAGTVKSAPPEQAWPTAGAESTKSAITGVERVQPGGTSLEDRTSSAPAAQSQPVALKPQSPARIDKRMAGLGDEVADREYQRGVSLASQGRMAEATDALGVALRANPEHQAARQTLVSFLIENRRLHDAERVLRAGLDLRPADLGLAVTLSRLLVERGDIGGASEVLDRHGAHSADPQVRAFRGALHQRLGRHHEAVSDYETALRANPAVAPWWVGLGISLQALERRGEAADAFRRARSSGNLSPELAQFVDQRLRSLD